MALDGITATALCEELDKRLAGARIDKIMQPDRYTIVLTLYNGRKQEQLTISANPSLPAIYLGDPKLANPQIPPSFCMLLRKHLQGGRLISVEIPPYERIFILRFQVLDEFQDYVEKRLIAELINRRTNIVLLNEAGTIHDSIIHVDHSINRIREILPAHPYQLPPSQDKLTPEAWLEQYDAGAYTFPQELSSLHLEKALVALIMGLSPFPAGQIVQGSGLDPRLQLKDLNSSRLDLLSHALAAEMVKIKKREWQPTLYFADADDPYPLDFYALDLPSYLHKVSIDSLVAAMTVYSRSQIDSNRLEQKKQHLRRLLSHELDAAVRKANIHRKDMQEGQDAGKWQHYGELILANLWQYQPGSASLQATDYYDPKQVQIEIPLRKNLSGPANAERYFRRANKAKNKFKIGSRLLAADERDIAWLQSMQTALETSNEIEDTEALNSEFRHYLRRKRQSQNSEFLRDAEDSQDSAQGRIPSGNKRRKDRSGSSLALINNQPGKPGKRKYKPPKPAANKRKAQSKPGEKPLPPRRYLSSDGLLITVGRNNIQNDQLTLRKAAKDDLWLHVKNAPGTHVIVKKDLDDIPGRTIEEAAGIAAWFSRKAGSRAKVEVDYCPVRNVKKPKGAHPGYVVYDDYATILSEPLDPAKLKKTPAD
ncbi:MAG TPA: NFACT RNA binding domain-containing protein [Bacillota bacterium]|nr:NFACT RNA binding domain-containing protein [Bacillota bacterium]